MPAPAKSLTNIERAVEAIERTIAPSIAGTQPSTVNPGTKSVVMRKTIAFTTKIKSPKVMIVNGKVRSTSTGFINVLITPRTIAASKAEVNVSTWIPGTM